MIGGVSINKIKKFKIPLPSLANQLQIVEEVNKLFNIINKITI